MNDKPSAIALRTMERLYAEIGPDYGAPMSDESIERYARIIDEETGLPELLEELEVADGSIDHLYDMLEHLPVEIFTLNQIRSGLRFAERKAILAKVREMQAD